MQVMREHAKSIMLGVSQVPEAVVEDGEVIFTELEAIKGDFSDTSHMGEELAEVMKELIGNLFL